MKHLFISFWFIMATACTHAPIKQLSDSSELFPDGIYHQNLAITFGKENFEFSGILKKGPKELAILAYVGPGFSIFKIKDVDGSPLSFTTSEPRIEKKKDFFIKIYPLLKEVIFLKKTDSRWKNNHMDLLIPEYNHAVQVKTEGDKITIFDEGHFNLDITNNQFEPLNSL